MSFPGMTKAAMRAVVLGSCAALALTAVPAEAAAPKKLGAVKGLTVQITKPAAYEVAADWADLAGATSYRVTLTTPTASVVRETTESDWTFQRNDLAYGAQLTVKVVPVKETKPRTGKPATLTKAVPDLVAPTGTYEVVVTPDTAQATVRQITLTDEGPAGATITQVIDWGDGSKPDDFTGTEHPHVYPPGPKVYHPTMTLTDSAGNSDTFDLNPTIVNDTEHPKGEFTVTPADVRWAKWSEVSLSQVSVWDDASDPADIDRVVHWGDGTTTPWLGELTPSHVYEAAGDYLPKVELTDEAGKTTMVDTQAFVVAADEAAPTTRIKRPGKAKRRSVRAWRTVRGTVVDAGVGAKSVRVNVVQQRGRAWYAYRATTRTWVKAASKRGALRKSRAAVVAPVDAAWKLRVKNLRKGTIIVKARGYDNVGNVSKPVLRSQALTRR